MDQITQALGKEDGALFCKYYDVTDKGNWFESRGHAPAGAKNILHVTKGLEAFAKLHSLDVEQFRRKLQAWRGKLLAIRAGRVPPTLDDKILSGWNGLMIASLAKGARVLNEPKFAKAAARAADFVLTKLRTKDGRLLRTYRMGQARLTGYLDDYAFMIDGLLNLYEATFDPRWLDEAVKLTDTLIEYYFDKQGGPGVRFLVFEDALARYHIQKDGITSRTGQRLECCLRIAARYAPELRSRPGSSLASLWFRVMAVHGEAVSAHRARGHLRLQRVDRLFKRIGTADMGL